MVTRGPDETSGAWVPHGRFTIDGRSGGPLAGLAFVAKDLFDVAGHPTGAGNPTWLATHEVPQRHASVVQMLLDAGATLWGKVVTDELAFSLHGDNLHYGTPRNARLPDCVPGGSSSGSAASVAAGLVDFALASDTGGSTRVPASYCGLWGLRTTHGTVPVDGMVPLHPSFDTATWLAGSAEVFEAVGRVLLPPERTVFMPWPTRVRVFDDAWALADPAFAEPLSCVVAALAQRLAVKPVHGPVAPAGQSLEDWRRTYMTVGAHEGWRTHGAWISTAKPAMAPPVAARWAAASRVSDGEALVARELKHQVREHLLDELGLDTVAVLPSAASPAPRRDADAADVDAVRLRTLAITCIAGLAGLPQVSLPMIGPRGQPVGVSLLGPPGTDASLIRLATVLHATLPSGLRAEPPRVN